MKFFVNSKPLLILLVLSISMWVYFILLSYLGDARVADSSLDGEEMYIWEMLLLISSLFSTFYLLGCSCIHCFKNVSKFLSFIIAFIWPLSYFYSLYVLVTNWGKSNAS